MILCHQHVMLLIPSTLIIELVSSTCLVYVAWHCNLCYCGFIKPLQPAFINFNVKRKYLMWSHKTMPNCQSVAVRQDCHTLLSTTSEWVCAMNIHVVCAKSEQIRISLYYYQEYMLLLLWCCIVLDAPYNYYNVHHPLEGRDRSFKQAVSIKHYSGQVYI